MGLKLFFASFFILFFLNGCEIRNHYETHDPTLNMREERYDQLLTTPPPPRPSKIIAKKSIKKTYPKEMYQKVSLASTSALPVQDVLMELGNQTQVSMVVDSKISAVVMAQAHKKPFIDVIKQICAMAKLRHHVEEEVLYIEEDKPFLKNYNVQFLNLIRQNASKISIATDVFSGKQSNAFKSSSSSESENGSNTTLKGETKSNFWEELELNLKMLLGKGGSEGSSNYSFHKQAGIIAINAPAQIHEKVEDYLELLHANIASQVLIEAKIVEVTLSDDFQSGINWNSIRTDFNLRSPLGRIAIPGPFNPNIAPARDVFSIGATGRSLTAIASLLSKFGTVRTLSNPRITTLNNQSAVINVTTNQIFFQVDYNREISSDKRVGLERASSRIQTVPIGLIMMVQPSINTETGKVTLHLRPSISRVTSFKEDPAIGILTNNTRTSQVPEVQVREIESVIHVGSGEVIVMGGLMEERSDNETSGVPGGKSLPPFFRPFLKSKSDSRTVTELVILLKVTILDNAFDSIAPADERVYQTFTKDPRPLTFNN